MISKKICTTVLLLFFSMLAMAQPELGFCEQEKVEKAEEQIKKAQAAIRQKNLRMANIYINNALKFQEDNADAFFLAGDVALRDKNLAKTEASWTKVLEICPDYKADLYFFLGVIHLENEKYEKADEMLSKFLIMPNRERGYDKEAKMALEEVKMKKNMFGNPVPFDPKPVRAICTTADEYLAIISPDQELCFFTRRQKKRDKYAGPTGKMRVVEEFTFATKTSNNEYTKGQAMDSPFNENYNEGGATITANNKELFFTVCQVNGKGTQNCDIYYCKKEYGFWGDIVPLSDKVNTPTSWESQPSVSPNGDVLYFTSNRPGGQGGLDIWRSKRLPNGEWEEAENLGPTINTAKNEKSPFIHSDSQTLYFGSDGHPTVGGYDIYFSKFDENVKNWATPVNIGYPINTEADEIALFVSLDGKTAYFSSNKLNAANGWDLYSFPLYKEARPERVALLKGALVDENNQVVEDAELEVKNLKTKSVTKIEVDKETGEFAAVVQLKEEENVILKVKKEGAAFNSKFIAANDDEATGVVAADLKVSPLEIGKEYRLNDIRFASNSYALSENAKQIIDEFILFLEENPRVKVDIQGHTDDVGNDADNLTLAKNRAEVVYNYIVQHGISASRLTHHGYGEERPITSNATPEGKAENRRTVFVITEK